jgi:hypothetical protein
MNGAESPRTVHIVVGYVVRPELEGLGDNPPIARLRVRVEPGARLAVDGQPVALDPQGAALVPIPSIRPLDPSQARATVTVALRVTAADGVTTEGTYPLELPRAPFALERPAGGTLVTASARAAVAVRAPGATAVLIDGAAAVRDGELFSSVVPVRESGASSVQVLVLRPRFAPATSTVTLERLAPGPAGLARLSPARGAPCVSPTVGQVFSLAGRVVSAPRTYNGGVSFQLEVRDRRCPGRSAAVWIDAEPDASVRERATVRVTGRYTGSRTALTSSGERRTDPVLHAVVLGR